MTKIIFPLRLRMQGEAVADLQDGLRLAIDRRALQLDSTNAALESKLAVERAKSTFNTTTRELVTLFQSQRRLQVTGAVDEATATALNALLEPLGAFVAPVTYQVDGRVASRSRAGVRGLQIDIFDKAVGGDVRVAHATAGDRGSYQSTFTIDDLSRRGKTSPDLQAKVFAGATLLGASAVRYNASANETLDVLLDETANAALASEHETLTADLSTLFQGRLSDLQETAQHQDITYLANKSGWDARAVAMAALAEQFAALTADTSGAPAIAPSFFYALFRAGVPANEDTLYQTGPDTVAEIWKQAIALGVIPAAAAADLQRNVDRFQQRAAARALGAPALAGLSSLTELMSISLGDDPAKQAQFADLYTRFRSDPRKLWDGVAAAFGDATAQRLRLDGQLAFLTLNNAPLVGKLRAAVGDRFADPRDLVDHHYYRADTWARVIGSDPVPPEIPGADAAEQRARYADLLAAQVRLSYPSAVVAAMVKHGETPLADSGQATAVHAFLTEHDGAFVIGRQPIAQFLADNNLQAPPAVIAELERIHRAYQITPGDEAMNALLTGGVDSAYAVVRYDRDAFVEAFKDAVGGESRALQIHARAHQVHNAVLNIAVSYLTAATAPEVGVHSPAKYVKPTPDPQAPKVAAHPTLETLFGAMDYCACEQCKSIFSPAAYLVDLLHFCDSPYDSQNLQKALLERRPDLQNLPLTCENTNTPLPYIDIVNETLEYFVAHKLNLDKDYHGHSTDAGVTAEELLASPQFVDDTVYTTLATQHFPPPLPFNDRLEHLRRLFDKCETPLPRVMEAFRKNDSVERANDGEYGWRDILMEELRLSREEYELLTDGSLSLQDLYGDKNASVASLSKVKALSHRLGMSYEDLVAVLGTRFVNPGTALIPLLQKLGLPFLTMKKLKDGTLTADQFNAAVAPGLDKVEYGGSFAAWVLNSYGTIMSLVVVANPIKEDDLGAFGQLELRYSLPDNSANALRPFEFVRLLRFVRLWRKLGWSIDQTDEAIGALYPADQTPNDPKDDVNLQRLDTGFRAMLPRLGVVVRVLASLKLNRLKDLPLLLSCVSPAGDAAAVALRQAWLARTLRISVQELSLVAKYSGIDPLAPPDPPTPAIERFVDMLNRWRGVSLKPVEALYLVWNQDVSGTSTPADQDILGFARALRASLAQIDSDFSAGDHPSNDVARAKMTLVYGADAADVFFSLLDNTLATTAGYSHPAPLLDTAVVEAAGGRISYDDLRKTLTFAGGMNDTTRVALEKGASPAFKDAVEALFAACQKKLSAFFDSYTKLHDPYSNFVASKISLSELLAAVVADLKQQRKRQQALQSIAAAANTDSTFAERLLGDAALLHGANASAPALDDLVAIEKTGLSAWSGYIEVPESGPYNIRVGTDAAAASVVIDGTKRNATISDGVWNNSDEILLDAGRLAGISIQAGNVKTLQWQSTGRGWEAIPDRNLYSPNQIEPLRVVYVRFLKVASLAARLKLTADEIAYLSKDGWLNQLTVSGDPDKGSWAALRDVLMRLVDCATLKAALSPDDARLLGVLQNPSAAMANSGSPLFALTRWEPVSLQALLSRFGMQPDGLADVGAFRRVSDAYAFVKTLRVPASAIAAAATNAPGVDTMATFRAALQTQFEPKDWLTFLRPISDQMRGLRRDALVAYILQQMATSPDPTLQAIDTAEKLFEYFLMDVEMEPCMQTSRIRHALSSVQLFIDRCLLDLEAVTLPSEKAAQWEWMKRYRLWEANRRVFVYPENWLESELLDNPSVIFKETMSELLQSDITDDRAVVALLNYLSKLEEIAKLEPCAIYYVEDNPETEARDDVVHVVARTAGGRKYFYRRREYGSWTPWEPITLDIEDNPVVPVVWNGRLLLFWLKLLKQSRLKPPSPTIEVNAVLCWSEYFNGKWQVTKTSDVNNPAMLVEDVAAAAFDRSQLETYVFSSSDGLHIYVFSSQGGCSFLVRNTHSLPAGRSEDNAANAVIAHQIDQLKRDLVVAGTVLRVTYKLGKAKAKPESPQPVLQGTLEGRVIVPRQDLGRAWDAPFFYEDAHHVFYVTTEERIVWLPKDTFGLPSSPHTFQVLIEPLLLPVVVAPDKGGPVAAFIDKQIAGPPVQFGGATINLGGAANASSSQQ